MPTGKDACGRREPERESGYCGEWAAALIRGATRWVFGRQVGESQDVTAATLVGRGFILFAVRGERKIWIEGTCDDLFSSRHRIPRRKRRISKRRAKELRKIVEESLARRVSFYENGAGSSSSKNGAAHAKAPNGRFAAEGAGTKNRRVRPQRVSARKPKRGKAANSH